MVFNIRVYGILMNELQQILLSDELINNKHYTKFPGGGLEFGEGTINCLIREFKEETDLTVEIEKHLYTTDFYQVSAFNPKHQIISIYYKVKVVDDIDVVSHIEKVNLKTQLQKEDNNSEFFKWVNLHDLTEDMLSLPIDKIVVRQIKNN
jgi:8-oxo-dGTP diphosphatase